MRRYDRSQTDIRQKMALWMAARINSVDALAINRRMRGVAL
jgi:hypothetical protein